jgi:DNA-binding CsgD family transcriptional regulator
MLRKRATRHDLTDREAQVLLAVGEGKQNDEIGRELFITEETVKSHVKHILAILGARNRAHAVYIGLSRGLIGSEIR